MILESPLKSTSRGRFAAIIAAVTASLPFAARDGFAVAADRLVQTSIVHDRSRRTRPVP
jgi:hypothetical protein